MILSHKSITILIEMLSLDTYVKKINEEKTNLTTITKKHIVDLKLTYTFKVALHSQ